MSTLPAVILCDGRSKSGDPCRKTVGSNGRQCRAHAPETAELARAEALKGREGKPSEALRAKVARDPDKAIAPIYDALEATKSYVTNGELVTVPDYPTRLKATEIILDRLEGKPAQRTEITGAGGGPLELLTLLAAASVEKSF